MSKQNQNNTTTSYSDSGVSIDNGNELINQIKPFVKKTARSGSDSDIGGFGGLFDVLAAGYDNPILVSATDGVGTKLKIANIMNKHDTVGIDLVAMCVNDIIVQGAEPLFFLDYFATGSLDINQAKDVVKSIAEGCVQANCALIGGETAEMPGMYKKGEYDLAGFSVGAVDRNKILPSEVKEGDIVIGLASSGIHSNGFSLIRYIVDNIGISYNDVVDGFDKPLGELLLEPTKIYVKTCLELIKNDLINALAHITGGGLTENIPRILPSGLACKIDLASWNRLSIFNWIQEKGNVKDEEMLRSFNCGIGMVLIVSADKLSQVEEILKNSDDNYNIIGKIIPNTGESIIYA